VTESLTEKRSAPRSDVQLWDSTDVALYLGVSESWVKHAAQRGEIPKRVIARKVRFIPDQIRQWVEDGMPVPSAESKVLAFRTRVPG